MRQHKIEAQSDSVLFVLFPERSMAKLQRAKLTKSMLKAFFAMPPDERSIMAQMLDNEKASRAAKAAKAKASRAAKAMKTKSQAAKAMKAMKAMKA